MTAPPPVETRVPHLATRVLFRSGLATVRDVDCRAPRAPAGAEEVGSEHVVIFPRVGVFVRHPATRARAHVLPIVADATHAVLLNAGEPYRVSHPADGGDRSTVIAVSPDVAREVAMAHDPGARDARVPAFGATHHLVPPLVRLRLGALRAALRAGLVSPLTAESVALEVLDAVLAGAADRGAGVRRTDSLPATGGRASTRRAHRELAEAVRWTLAHAPEAAMPLAALARRVAASPYHLTRVFQAEVGLPVHQYQIRLRLALAVERLAEPGTSLSALALDLGFASHGHFARAFRRAYGVTPSAARDAVAIRGSRALPTLAPSRPG